MPKNSSKPKKRDADAGAAPRTLKTPKYRSFHLQKKRLPKPVVARIPGCFRLLRTSLGVIKRNWKLFLGIAGVYALLNVLLVQNFFGVDIGGAKATLEAAVSGGWGKFAGGFSLLSYMFGNSGTAQSTSAYRLILLVIASLAIIWALRQIWAGAKIRIRDSFYNGMHPMIPFILVFLTASVQLVPLAIALYFFTVAGAHGGVEVLLWGCVLGLLSGLTLYWLSSSLFALYIVCLPNTRPVEALRLAADLVRHRRWPVIRRLLFLPLAILVVLAAVMLPVIFFATPLAVWVFFVFLMVVPLVVHSYMYALYRGMLHEG